MVTAVCPIHGSQRVESLPAKCPVKLRKTIAGVAEVGTCGRVLEAARD